MPGLTPLRGKARGAAMLRLDTVTGKLVRVWSIEVGHLGICWGERGTGVDKPTQVSIFIAIMFVFPLA